MSEGLETWGSHVRTLKAIARARKTPARERLLALREIRELLGIGPKPRESDPMPADPLDALRWRLADVQERIPSAEGIAYCQLLTREQELNRAISEEVSRREEAARRARQLDGSQSERIAARVAQLCDAELVALYEAITARLTERGLRA
jgi:hypothetical protein